MMGWLGKGHLRKLTPVMKKGTSHDRSRDRILLSKSFRIAMFNEEEKGMMGYCY